MAFVPPTGNITSGVGFFNYMNTTISGWFIPGIILAIFFIALIKLVYSTNSVSRAFASSSFVCMILSVMFRVIDLVSTPFMTIFIILTGVGIVWMHIENAGGSAQ